MNKKTAIAATFSTIALIAAIGGTAVAASVSEGRYVSCDMTITDTLKAVTHSSTGTLAIRQDTDPAITSTFWARSSTTGKNLSPKNAVDGGTASWTKVAASKYTFYTHPATSRNCNGILPGDGNTWMNFRITF